MREIAVLGAGPMGLAVAYQLSLDGYKPVVFEAADRIGGMAACFDFNGLQIERYYHFHCLDDDVLLQTLDELGIADKMCWAETSMAYWYMGRLQAWGNPLALLKFRGLGLIAKLRYALHAWYSIQRTDWRALDELEATRWIRRWVGEEAYTVLWKKLFEFKFYEFADRISAAWIWNRIHRLGRSRSSLLHERLGYLRGGTTTLLHAMQGEIENRGGEMHLSTPVQRVVIDDGQVVGIEIGGALRRFDRVVSTIPLPYVPDLIPGLPAQVLTMMRGIRNIGVVCVIARLRRPLSKHFWININDPELDIPGLVEFSNLRPLKDHIVYAPLYMPVTQAQFSQPDQYFIDKIRHCIRKINPEFGNDDILDVCVNRYRHAQPVCEPGHAQRIPPIALPVDGLWVADTSYYYPNDRGMSESIELGREMAKMAIAC